MRQMMTAGLSLVLGLIFSVTAQAEDLFTLYQKARCNDPTLQAAKASQLAAKEALPQARAQFLPTFNATALFSSNSNTQPPLIGTPGTIGSFRQDTYTVNLTQPVLHFPHWAKYSEASYIVKQANASYAAAEQDLMIRLATAYFNVLFAYDSLSYARSQRAAYKKSFEQASERFKVGLIAVTDKEISKAKYDSAHAQVIAAEKNVLDQKEKLREIIGCPVQDLAFLGADISLPSPCPLDPERWVMKAVDQNFILQAQRYKTKASWKTMRNIEYGHLPTIDVVANSQNLTAIPTGIRGVNNPATRNQLLGIQVNIPILNGGSILSQTRQALHLYEQNDRELEKQLRTVESETRQAYQGVLSQISQAVALKQAVISNESAVKATQASFSVGTRTIVDLLNAESDLYSAKRDYALARYNYIIQSLTLKQNAGILCPEDLLFINHWLTSRAPSPTPTLTTIPLPGPAPAQSQSSTSSPTLAPAAKTTAPAAATPTPSPTPAPPPATKTTPPPVAAPTPTPMPSPTSLPATPTPPPAATPTPTAKSTPTSPTAASP